LAQRDSGGILVVLLAILYLAGSDVTDQLGELDRIARTLFAGLGHAPIIAQPDRGRTTDSRAPDFKLTHYPPPTLPEASRDVLYRLPRGRGV
jgi:hypothetical protein